MFSPRLFVLAGSLLALVGAAGCSGGTTSGAAGSLDGTSGAGGTSRSGGSDDGARDASLEASMSGTDASILDSGGGSLPSDGAATSTGCGMPAGQALSTYVVKDTMSGGVARSYRLYLPAGYDPMRPYPTIILGHGCGGNGGTPFPIEQASKGDAIVVALKSADSCFVYSPTGPDVTYFDTVLAEVSASHCVDETRVFMAGFSSGSWLTHTVGCVRAGVVRGQGNASGNQVNLSNCTGPIAAMFAHDVNDTTNTIAGAVVARDRILKANGCGTETVPYDFDGDPATPSTCVSYQGCMPGYPVVWCPTMAAAGRSPHNSQVPISTIGFWRFWSQL